MGRRDITGVDSNIGSEFKKGMNRYNATTSFRRDGVTYFIEINDMYGTNVIATWWDNSDNGFGYNNYGDVYVNNPFNRMTGSFSPENIDDYIGVNSAYDRNLPASLKKAIINRVKRYIDYDALNDVRRTESIKKGSKSNMKLRISEARSSSGEANAYVVFRQYYNDYTDTWEPIAFWWGDGQPMTYGRVNIIEQDGNVPYMRTPRYVNDEADINYFSETKAFGSGDDGFDEFSDYVRNWLLKDERGDGFDNVIYRTRLDRYGIRDAWMSRYK